MTVRSFEGIAPCIADSAYVDPTALVIGQVTLGAEVSIWPMAVVRGDVNSIVIEERTNVQDGSVLHVTHDGPQTPGGYALRIGHDVTVGHFAVLHGCIIEPFCLIGLGTMIMDGALVRSRTLIGAGSLVPPGKEVCGEHLWMGRPVQKIRPLTEAELGYFAYSADHYVRTKNRHQKG